jgi:hypothetical protein
MESLPNLEAGKNVLVNVEGVFNGGVIVAFNTSEGSEFRGALLQTSSCSTCGYVLCVPLHTSVASTSECWDFP